MESGELKSGKAQAGSRHEIMDNNFISFSQGDIDERDDSEVLTGTDENTELFSIPRLISSIGRMLKVKPTARRFSPEGRVVNSPLQVYQNPFLINSFRHKIAS
jgi:hypothetical protein